MGRIGGNFPPLPIPARGPPFKDIFANLRTLKSLPERGGGPDGAPVRPAGRNTAGFHHASPKFEAYFAPARRFGRQTTMGRLVAPNVRAAGDGQSRGGRSGPG